MYVALLAAYGYMAYAQDMVNIMVGYIGVALVMTVMFVMTFVFFFVAKLTAKFVTGILITEWILIAITGIVFLKVGFIAGCFIPPSMFLGTICGLRKKNLLF